MRTLPVVLPHHLVQYLSANGMLDDELSAADELRQYWRHVMQYTDWGQEHPCINAPGRSLPTFLYGDDVKFSQQEKLTCVYWGFVLSKKTFSMDSHFPLFIIREAGDDETLGI